MREMGRDWGKGKGEGGRKGGGGRAGRGGKKEIRKRRKVFFFTVFIIDIAELYQQKTRFV